MFTTLDFDRQISDSPEIYVIDDFLASEQCQHIIDIAKPHMRPAVVSSANKGVSSSGRTGSVHWIKHNKTPTVQQIVHNISDLVEIPTANAESLQVIYYDKSQQYRPHFDAYDLDTPAGKRCTANGGQRLLTVLLYLNNVDTGGHTVFPKMKKSVSPKKGRMVVFKNCHQGTNTRHPFSLHAGEPVLKGEKWAFNLWYRERSRA